MSGSFEARVEEALASCSLDTDDRVRALAAAADWALAKRSLRAHGFDRIAAIVDLDGVSLHEVRRIVREVAGEISEKKARGGLTPGGG